MSPLKENPSAALEASPVALSAGSDVAESGRESDGMVEPFVAAAPRAVLGREDCSGVFTAVDSNKASMRLSSSSSSCRLRSLLYVILLPDLLDDLLRPSLGRVTGVDDSFVPESFEGASFARETLGWGMSGAMGLRESLVLSRSACTRTETSFDVLLGSVFTGWTCLR